MSAGLLGPKLPRARCRDCDTVVTFERRRGLWRCHCEGCVDGEYVYDEYPVGGLRMSVRSGEGDTPWGALDDMAAMCWDCEPVELLVREDE